MTSVLCQLGSGQVARAGRGESVACTEVERTYHHYHPARYTGHRAGSPLA